MSVQTGRLALSSAVGFGALNLDKIYRVDKIPKADEEGFVRDLQLFPGGSAANTIVGLARLGIRTAYIGKVGDDAEGGILLEDLKREGVDTRAVIKARGRSGTAIIFVDDSGNRAILVDPGVNDTIRYEEIDQKKIVDEFELVSFDPGMPYAERGKAEMMQILRRTTIFFAEQGGN
jgi:ribokinase